MTPLLQWLDLDLAWVTEPQEADFYTREIEATAFLEPYPQIPEDKTPVSVQSTCQRSRGADTA